MRVLLGNYINFFGPYQIAEKLLFWMNPDDDRVFRLGEILSGDVNEKPSLLARFCQYIHDRRTRTIYVKIDDFDVWNVDGTLALIIAPLLKKLKTAKHSSAKVDDCDVPDHLKSTSAPPVEKPWDIDDNWEARWDYVLDEMIWAFEQHDSRLESEAQFWDSSDVDHTLPVMQQVKQMHYDRLGHEAWLQRKQKGFELFGKYFTSLWS